MLLPDYVHSSWKPFLTGEILEKLDGIERKIGIDYNPDRPEVILRFLTTDLFKVKVIWLGQDVYPMKGAATGRAFEVGGLADWAQPFRQVSLKNILRLLHKQYNGIERYEDIKPFSEVKKEIVSGQFPIPDPPEWFDSLERQGVLFLNTSFTCEPGKPNSHKHIWNEFSQEVLGYISAARPDCIWFLWGKEAIAMKAFIPEGNFFESRHPMMCSGKYPDDFLKFTGFERTSQMIKWI